MKVYDENGAFANNYTGYSIDLIYALSEIMKFEFELYEAPDGQYGNMNEQGEWNGAIKELIDQVGHLEFGKTHQTWLFYHLFKCF